MSFGREEALKSDPIYIGPENDAALKSLNAIQTIYLGRGGMEGPDRRNVDKRSGPSPF